MYNHQIIIIIPLSFLLVFLIVIITTSTSSLNTPSDSCQRTITYGIASQYLCGPPDYIVTPDQAGKHVEHCITSSLQVNQLPSQTLLTISPRAPSYFEPFDIDVGSTSGDCYVEATGNSGWTNYPDIGMEIVPQFSGTFIFDTIGSSFDTVLWLTQCDDVNQHFSEVLCDDNLLNQSGWSSLVVSLVANVSYHLVVDGYGIFNPLGENLVLNINSLQSCPHRTDNLFITCPHIDACATNSLRGTLTLTSSDFILDSYASPQIGECTSSSSLPDYSFSLVSGTDANYEFISNIPAMITIRQCSNGVIVACVMGQIAEAPLMLDQIYVITIEPISQPISPQQNIIITYQYRPDHGFGITSSPSTKSPSVGPPTTKKPTVKPTVKPSVKSPTKKPTSKPVKVGRRV
jgi:hypothetical protein